ncbi:zinc finger protein 300-like [Pseudophryne corroboree]|uniref:zinc finger protein 300-like n=1 Tax=Pseudophryne corroboree TaxID=495146 RepID=UPI003081A6A1
MCDNQQPSPCVRKTELDPEPHHGASTSLIRERHNDQKILELTNKIIQLLTGEEWEYIKEHRGLYKDVMMENHRPLTSLDGASNRNTPERCSRPLYSQDRTEENRSIPQEDQAEGLPDIKAENLEGEENMCVTDMKAEDTEGEEYPEEEEPYVTEYEAEDTGREEETYVPNIQAEDTEGEEEMNVRGDQQCKEEEIPTDISTDGASNRNTPERCPRPLYSQDHTQENHSVPQEGQDRGLADNVEHMEPEEKTYMRDDQQCKGEEIPTDICTVVGCTSRNTSEGHLIVSPDGQIEDKNIRQDSPGENPITLNMHPALHGLVISSEPCTHEECSDKSDLATHRIDHYGDTILSCSESGKSSICKSVFVQQQRTRTGEKPFSCSECGNSFANKSDLVRHQKIHTCEKPYSCSECGKCFKQKSHLIRHQRSHTGEKPFPCSECWNSFANKSCLVRHHRIHTGEKPYSCSDCGKCFTWKSEMVVHQRIHTGEQPFTCNECEKCFTQKTNLVIHQRSHTGEKPYSCSECGKCFTQKSSLVIHQRRHTDEKPFSCFWCEKCFRHKSQLLRHQSTHTGKMQFKLMDIHETGASILDIEKAVHIIM